MGINVKANHTFGFIVFMSHMGKHGSSSDITLVVRKIAPTDTPRTKLRLLA